GPGADLVPWAQREGRVVIAYSPLGQGLLSGRYQESPPKNFRRFRSDFRAGSRARLAPLVAALKSLGAKHGATPAQFALAWLIHKPNVVAIPGASSVRQVEENVAATEVDLADDEAERLSALAPVGYAAVRLEAVELIRIGILLVAPFETSFGVQSDRDILLVKAITSDGEGWGECVAGEEPTYSAEYADGAQHVLTHHLLPRLFDQAELTADDVGPLLRPVRGHQMAKAAIEMAVLAAE